LNLRRKSASIGLTATMLATLFTIVAAPLVSAATSVTPVGNVPRGGSATGLVYTFTESDAACLPNAAGSLTVVIADSASAATVSYTGTAVAAGPGSLGTITAAAAAQTLTVSWTASDPLNIESITVSGLGISATTAAALGAIKATLASASLACFQAGGTASGVLATGVAITGTAATVNVTTLGCTFVATAGAPGAFAFAAGAVGTTAESLEGTAGALAAGQQVLTITTAGGFTSVHNAGDVVTQTNACAPSGVLASPGTVVDSLIYLPAASVPLLFPGENNQLAGNLLGGERTIGFLSIGTTLTFAISTAGVTYGGTLGAPVPTIASNVAGLTFSTVSLNAARTEATATVLTASTALPGTAALPSFTLSNIRYDVAASVPSGTSVNVTLTLSGGKVVTPTSRSNAQIGRVFTATSPAPSVNIGQNGQTAGLITLTEATAGSFTAGSGPNNVFEICLDGTAAFTSPGPIATVTGGVAAGNVILREGAVASPDNVVPGTPDPANPGCYYWTVWTASTTVSTIVIGSSATAGPLVNVFAGQPAGPLNATLSVGSLGALTAQVTLAIANRVFANQVQVTAVSQPIMAPGATHALAGNILIQETASGQLKNTERVCVEIVPNQNTGALTDAYMSSLNTSDLPIATAENGVTVGPVTFATTTCTGLNGNVGNLPDSFSFLVTQQSTTANGKVTISNIHYSVLNDAATGPVQVNVYGFGVGGTLVDFQRIISNASIGNPVAGTAATRLGVTQVGSFTTSTKVAKVGKYVTYRFDFGVAAAGKRVEIWGATKTGNDWSAFAKVTARIANSSGVVYYYIRQNSATWKSYRGYFVDGGSWSPARQARWIR